MRLTGIKGSARLNHQAVSIDGSDVGEVWKEQVDVVVSKMTDPRRLAKQWRWFSKRTGASATLGRGTRAAMLLGPGFKSKDDAIAAMREQLG